MWIPVKDPKMQSVSFKFNEGRYENWRCCFCCHVRTATIFLGIWHLVLHMVTLSVVAVLLRHPQVLEPADPALPTPLATNYSPPSYNGRFLASNSVEYQHLNVSVVVIFSTFAITLLMVYGAIKGKPSYLMPFFCLQLFDFCIASLTALTYLCYLPDMHGLVADSPRVPLKEAILQLSPRCLALLVFVTFLSAMLVKAYFIGVVWNCYKYLSLRLMSQQRTVRLVEAEAADRDLLPDYDTACSKFPPPPPSYNMAVSHPPPPPAV